VRKVVSRKVAAIAVLPLLAMTFGCSKNQTRIPVGNIAKPRAAEADLPDQILGLQVIQEDVSKDIAEVRSATYVSSVALFSMREGDLLQASLQVASLNDLAKPSSERFRKQVVGLMGGGSLEELTIGERKVYMTSGKQQVVYAWFKGKGFNVLTVRRAYPFRRTLLRKLLALEEPE
jgi:hypothetical protein